MKKIRMMKFLGVAGLFLVAQSALAEGMHRHSDNQTPMAHDPFPVTYAVMGDFDTTEYEGEPLVNWATHAWFGGDTQKIHFQSEGEWSGGHFKKAELWGLYSRPISDFWDAVIGVRHDVEPQALTYAVLGLQGMLPQFIETEASLLVSEEGDVLARLDHHLDVPLTQQLITQPHVKFDLSAQNNGQRHLSTGLVRTELGLQTRYEITRKFAPYLDLNYERTAGAMADHARDEGESVGAFTLRGGLKLWF